jgi:hypothetical protein
MIGGRGRTLDWTPSVPCAGRADMTIATVGRNQIRASVHLLPHDRVRSPI